MPNYTQRHADTLYVDALKPVYKNASTQSHKHTHPHPSHIHNYCIVSMSMSGGDSQSEMLTRAQLNSSWVPSKG